jgi:hypothetical protein
MSDSGRDWGASSDEEIAKRNAAKRQTTDGQRKAIDFADEPLASEVIRRLQEIINRHGDICVCVRRGNGLAPAKIDIVDVCPRHDDSYEERYLVGHGREPGNLRVVIGLANKSKVRVSNDN